MKTIFQTSSAHTVEAYKKVIKKRMFRMGLLFFVGAVALLLSFFGNHLEGITLSEHMRGVYAGLGAGLMGACVAAFLRLWMILRNEQELKKNRLKEQDERIQAIGAKAMRLAGFMLFVSAYVIGLIGGLFYPILIAVMVILVAVFMITYTVAYHYYNRRM